MIKMISVQSGFIRIPDKVVARVNSSRVGWIRVAQVVQDRQEEQKRAGCDGKVQMRNL